MARADETTPMREGRTVLICDDRAARRGQLNGLGYRWADGTKARWVGDGFTLAEEYGQCPADVVLIGIRGILTVGMDAVDLIVDLYPEAPVVVYGARQHSDHLATAIAQGARGLTLWDPLQPGASRAGWFTPGSPSAVIVKAEAATITGLDLQVLRGMSHGMSNVEIGETLLMSDDAVKFRARRIYGKLHARDRAHAVAQAFRLGYLTVSNILRPVSTRLMNVRQVDERIKDPHRRILRSPGDEQAWTSRIARRHAVADDSLRGDAATCCRRLERVVAAFPAGSWRRHLLTD